MEPSKVISDHLAPDWLSTPDGVHEPYFKICMQCQQKKLNCKGSKLGLSSCNQCSTRGLDCAWVLEQDEEQQKAYRVLSSNDLENGSSSKRAKRVSFNAKLACPYYKRNPEIHKGRDSCAESTYPTISRLKQHLKRIHKLGPHCQRCFAFFGSEPEVGKHYQSEKGCQRNEPPDDSKGYNKAKERLVFDKKTAQGETEEERWKEIYRILFPRDDESGIPNPSHGDSQPAQIALDDAQQYKQYFRKEYQRVVKALVKGLVRLIEEECGHLDESLRAKLHAYALRSQSEAFAFSAMPNQNAGSATGVPLQTTGTDKLPVSKFSGTTGNASPKEARSHSRAISQRLKDGADTAAVQNLGAYDTPSLLAQEMNQIKLARDPENKAHQTSRKSMPHEGVKDVQQWNPFGDSSASPSQPSQPLFWLGQDTQVDNGAASNLLDRSSTIQTSQSAYSMSVIQGGTSPSSLISPTTSTNPFLSPPIFTQATSRPTGLSQLTDKYGLYSRWNDQQGWNASFSVDGF